MTTPVVTVTPDTPFPELVDLMVDHDIGGLPVVDETGTLIGIVTGADLVSKEAHGGRRRSVIEFLGDLVAGGEPVWVSRSRGRYADQLMTRQLVTARESEDARTAARRMLDKGVERLPVLGEGGGLVGIVSRSDLLRALHRTDAEIRAAVQAALDDPLRTPAGAELELDVRDGVVTLSGTVDLPHDLPALDAIVWSTPGVVALNNDATARHAEPRRADR